MNEILRAIILGIVQGLTEFLPVSSSGHLAVIEHAMHKFGGGGGFFVENIFFDVTLHFASLLAILLFFRRRIVDIFRMGNRRVLLLVVVGSAPAGIVGVLLSKLGTVEAMRGMPGLVGACFLVTALLLKMSDYGRERGFALRESGWRRSLFIGVGQALGVLPGVSRSGSTISTGLMAGLKREDAVAFSFLLAIPAILGATALEAVKLLKGGCGDVAPNAAAIIAGSIAAFAVSLFAIRILVALVRLKKFSLFAYYCLLAAAAAFVIAIMK